MEDAPRTHGHPIEPDGVWTREEQSAFKRAQMTYLKYRSAAEKTVHGLSKAADSARQTGEKLKGAGSRAAHTARSAAGAAAVDGGLIDRIGDGVDQTIDSVEKISGAPTADRLRRTASQARSRLKSAARRLSDTDDQHT